jgi:hypothetical protein
LECVGLNLVGGFCKVQWGTFFHYQTSCWKRRNPSSENCSDASGAALTVS